MWLGIRPSAKVPAGSLVADQTIHDAFGLVGPVLPYTRDAAAARGLLPAGFEWAAPTYSGGMIYAACSRSGLHDGLPHPHHGQWGQTLPLAMCGAVMRARAGLAKG
jgi:hypothetical protein